MVTAVDLEQTRLKNEAEDAAPILPDSVQAPLSRLLNPEESIEAFVECDLLPSGQFGESWLFATSTRIGLFVPASPTVLARNIPIEQIRKLERRQLHGATVVEAVTASEAIVAARTTAARLDALNTALPLMQRLIPTMEPEERPHWRRKKEEKTVCPKCGNPLPPWSGVCMDCLQKRKLIFRLLGRVTRYWPIIVLGLTMMVAMQAATLAQPWLNAQLIDHAIRGRKLGLLWKIIALLVGLNVVSQIIGAFRTYLMAWFGQKVIYDLREELYAHIQRLSIAFYDSKQTGWIMDRLTSDTNNLQDFLTDALQDFIRDSVTLVGIAVIMFAWNWRLAALTLIPVPFIAYSSHVLMKKSHRLWHRVWRKRSRISSLLSDVIPGVRVVKAFVGEGRETRRFAERNSDFMNASVSASRTFAFFGPITGLLAVAGSVIVWADGGYQAITQPKLLTVGALVAFIQYLWQFYQPVQNLSRMTQRFQWSATAAQRVFEVLDTPPDVRDAEKAAIMPPIVGRVEFDNATFGYEPHLEVLKGVSFVAEPGEMIGLVGPSGAGKSTTINLLCRFYDVLDGAIRIDGIDIRDVTLDSLREQIGVVLQEPFLFHGTLFDNIAYGRPAATRREVIEAAKAANCHEFILRFPDGYDTVVGERGTRLSGGERQRISIARAILKNPRILILDEATSSVDTETEGQIRQALDRLVRGRTTIAIAHRFSTLRHADRLVVLSKGKVAEIGTHAELLAREDGLFRKLSDQQMQLSQIIAVSG